MGNMTAGAIQAEHVAAGRTPFVAVLVNPEGGSVPLRVIEEVREVPAKPRGRRFFRMAFFLSPSPDVSCRSSGRRERGWAPVKQFLGLPSKDGAAKILTLSRKKLITIC